MSQPDHKDRFRGYAILGDDVVITDGAVAKQDSMLLDNMGVTISEAWRCRILSSGENGPLLVKMVAAVKDRYFQTTWVTLTTSRILAWKRFSSQSIFKGKGHCVKRLKRCKVGLDLVESWRRTVQISLHFSRAMTSGIRAELLLMGENELLEPRYYWIGNQHSCSGTVCAETWFYILVEVQQLWLALVGDISQFVWNRHSHLRGSRGVRLWRKIARALENMSVGVPNGPRIHTSCNTHKRRIIMEISSSKLWIPEMGMDYSSFFPQNQMNPLDYYLDELNFQSFSSESYNETSHKRSASSYTERPAKQLRTNSWHSCTSTHEPSPSSSSQIISFDNSTSSTLAISPPVYGHQDYAGVIPKTEAGSPPGNINLLPSLISYPQETSQLRIASTTTRSTLQAQDHVIAERKRREKLSQHFIALSALLPGLKKTDKASILGDAIKHLQKLQERVKTLEEQTAKKTMESMIIVKKSHMMICSDEDETSSTDENFNSKLYLPHIEARVSDRDVLIRIHCENHKGCIVNILNEIEKLPLTVVNSNVLPFGNSTLDVTVVAQMEVGLTITVKDFVKKLRQALLKFM
ncbi:hypothetical protein Q3G72_019717 [Acer saccharum]|nr:hypothetical protein Q3G72_019717 [Acer saccharum]